MNLIGRLLKWLRGEPEKSEQKPRTLICMRQANTHVWPRHLGARTEGTCDECGAEIYFEAQNAVFQRKICHVCMLNEPQRSTP